MSPNKYSHALVLSYYESRGWITLPPAFNSPFVALDHEAGIRYHQQPTSNGRKGLGFVADLPITTSRKGYPSSSPSSQRVVESNSDRKAQNTMNGRSGVRDPSTPRSVTPSSHPRRRQSPPPMIPFVQSTPTSKYVRPSHSHRATPSIGSTVTEIYDPEPPPEEEETEVSTPGRVPTSPPPPLPCQTSNSMLSPSLQRDSSYSYPSPTSTIFRLLDSESEPQDDFDLSPTLTSGSSMSSSSRTEPVTPSSSRSFVDQDSPILKPFDDFIPTIDAFNRFVAVDDLPHLVTPWKDPFPPSTTTPAVFCLQPADPSHHPALRPSHEDNGDEAVPPPIARHRRLGVVAPKPKPDRSAMSFLKSSPSTRPGPDCTVSEKRSMKASNHIMPLGSKPDQSPMSFLKASVSSSNSPSMECTVSEKKFMTESTPVVPVGSGSDRPHGNHRSAFGGWIKGSKFERWGGLQVGDE